MQPRDNNSFAFCKVFSTISTLAGTFFGRPVALTLFNLTARAGRQEAGRLGRSGRVSGGLGRARRGLEGLGRPGRGLGGFIRARFLGGFRSRGGLSCFWGALVLVRGRPNNKAPQPPARPPLKSPPALCRTRP